MAYVKADDGKLWNYYLVVSNAKAALDGECEDLRSTLEKLAQQIDTDIRASRSMIASKQDQISEAREQEEPDRGRIDQLQGEIAELEMHISEMQSKKSYASSYRSEISRRQQACSEPFRRGLKLLNEYLNLIEAVLGPNAGGGPSGGGSGGASGAGGSGGFHKMSFRGMTFYCNDSAIDINQTDSKGRTNLQRMQGGLAPLGSDGLPMNLHHMQQSETGGGMMELSSTTHSSNHSVLHINSGTNIPSGINRKSFNVMRRAYWKQRAKSFG